MNLLHYAWVILMDFQTQKGHIQPKKGEGIVTPNSILAQKYRFWYTLNFVFPHKSLYFRNIFLSLFKNNFIGISVCLMLCCFKWDKVQVMIWLDVMIIVIIIVVSEFSLSIIRAGKQEQGYTHSLAAWLLAPRSGVCSMITLSPSSSSGKWEWPDFSSTNLQQKYEGWHIEIPTFYD